MLMSGDWRSRHASRAHGARCDLGTGRHVRCVVAPRNENPQTARGCDCAAGGAETTCLRRSSRFKVDAFSFAEIVVVVAILAVLLTFVLVGVARARASARSAQCVN